MANKAESKRIGKLSAMGCQACRKNTGAFVQGEICHHTDGGRRQGDDRTFTLCPWHHRGSITPGMTGAEMLQLYGPSFAKNKRAFVETYGSESDLVEEANIWLGYNRDPDWNKSTASPSPPSTTAASDQTEPSSKPGSETSSVASSRSPRKRSAKRSSLG